MSSGNKFLNFIRKLPANLAALKGLQSPQPLKLVLCNETCDLDSCASAIALSHYLSERYQNVFPVLNTDRRDLILRTDVVTLFNHYEISEDNLIFLEDVYFLRDDPKLMTLTDVILVDHNYPSGNCLWLVDNVTSVIDHHEILPHDKAMSKCERMFVEKVGSCSTLVAEEIFNNSDESYKPDPSCSALLLAAILVDTVCGSPSAGRQTPKDAEMVAKLDATAVLPYNHGRYFDWLMSAKFDISKLSTYDLLRKDSKIVTVRNTRVVTCSITSSLDAILRRPDFSSAVEQYIERCDSKAAAIICLSYPNPDKPDQAERELSLFSDDKDFVISLASWLQLNKSCHLLLSPYVSDTIATSRVELLPSESQDDSGTASPNQANLFFSDKMIAFSQGNVRASRKQILPLIEEYLRVHH